MVVLIALVFGTAFPLFFAVLALQVEVQGDGLYYRFFPFHLRYRRIGWSDMSAYAPVSYRPLSTYRGWGIRWGAGGGKAYNIAGNLGVRFGLADGRKVLFGSADPSGFAEAVHMASGIGADLSGVCDNAHRCPPFSGARPHAPCRRSIYRANLTDLYRKYPTIPKVITGESHEGM